MPVLYVHIGLPRTGTTFIQNSVFPRVESIDYFMKPRLDAEGEVNFASLFKRSPYLWNDIGGKVLKETFKGRSGMTEEKDVLVSSEVFTEGISLPGRPFEGVKTDPHLVGGHMRGVRNAATELGFGRTRVIVGVRRQDTWLASRYALNSSRVRRASQEDFEKWVRYILNPLSGYYKGGGFKLNYYELRRNLVSCLGRDNVLFMPLELLKEDLESYLERLFGFLGVRGEGERIAQSLSSHKELNPNSLSSSTDIWELKDPTQATPRLRPARIFQAIGLPTRLPLTGPLKFVIKYWYGREESVRISEEIKTEVMSFYNEANKKLDRDMRRVSLKSYGYWSEYN